MSKDKQIEEKHELSTSIYMSGYGLLRKDCDDIAEQLYDEGYRKQRKAERKKDEHGYPVCSWCEAPLGFKSNYCHNCGAKMKGGEE